MGVYSKEEVMNALRKSVELRDIGKRIEIGGPGKWRAIREYYAEMDDSIRSRWPGMCSPYGATDWRLMTPIEQNAWNAIRRIGLPFYPQYPVGRFFADFADPVAQLAIECDGKHWHDAQRDAARDAEFRQLGWQVFRFTGRQCVIAEEHPESIDSFLEGLRPRYRPDACDEDEE